MNTVKEKKLKSAIVGGAFFGLVMSVVYWLIGYENIFLLTIISTICFSLAVYFITSSKTVNEQTKLLNVEESDILYSDVANHFLNGEAAGGKLYLTKDKLIFKSHLLNFQNHQLSIELDTIISIELCMTSFIVPNGLKIITEDQVQRFVVNSRKTWKEKIEEAKYL